VVDHIYVDWIFWLHEVFDSWPSRWRYRFTSSPPLPDAPWRETRAVRSVYVIKGTRVSRRRSANKRTAYTRPVFCVYIYMRSCCNSDRSRKGKKRRGNRFSGVVFYLFIILFFYFYDFDDDDDDDDHRSACVRARPRFIVQSFPRPRLRVHVQLYR